MSCTCEQIERHEIARRSTSDGKHVLLWDDGCVTWALGYTIKGSPQPRTDKGRSEALAAGWLMLGDVELYETSEVTDLISAARWAVGRDGLPATMRRRFYESRAMPSMIPSWQVLQTDRDGRPTCRVWRLPRILYCGLAVWHESGTYSVVRSVRRDDCYEDTGFKSRTLKGVIDMLPELRGIHS